MCHGGYRSKKGSSPVMGSSAEMDHMDIFEPMQLHRQEHIRQSRRDYATKSAMAAWRTRWRIFRLTPGEFGWIAARVVTRLLRNYRQDDGGKNIEEPILRLPFPFFKEPRIQFSPFGPSSGLLRNSRPSQEKFLVFLRHSLLVLGRRSLHWHYF